MTPATKSLVDAFADALRREDSARQAAAEATQLAWEATQDQDLLHDQLLAAGIKTSVVARMVFAAAGEPADTKRRKRFDARLRKRLERRRATEAPGQSARRGDAVTGTSEAGDVES